MQSCDPVALLHEPGVTVHRQQEQGSGDGSSSSREGKQQIDHGLVLRLAAPVHEHVGSASSRSTYVLTESIALFREIVSEYIHLRHTVQHRHQHHHHHHQHSSAIEADEADSATNSSSRSIEGQVSSIAAWTSSYSMLAAVAMEGLATIAYVLDPSRYSSFLLQV